MIGLIWRVAEGGGMLCKWLLELFGSYPYFAVVSGEVGGDGKEGARKRIN
jgi:hypothetical protein